ncbi:MAG: hypothetical protein ACHQCF_07415 [Solirubrobacterales bacterium]
MTRLRTILIFAALAGLATVFAACGSSGGSGSEEDPKAVLKDATFEGIESANLDLSLGIKVSGKQGGNIEVKVSGPFQSRGKGQLPEFNMNAEASGTVNGKEINFEGGLALVPNKAFVSYEGEDYEVDPTTFSFIESAINQANSKGETPTETSAACQKAAAGLKVGDFVENLTNEGSADVGGTETTKVSGDLNVAGAIDQILKLSENPACSSSLENAGPLPLAQLSEAKSEVEKALKSAHVAVYVGEDHIVRRVTAEFSIEPEGSEEKVEMNLDLAFNEVNEEQEITTPSSAQPLNGLFQKLGINPIELLQGVQSGNGFNLEGLLNQAIGGAGGGAGIKLPGGASNPSKVQKCAKEATSASDFSKCVAEG